jgi:hypothetical protein
MRTSVLDTFLGTTCRRVSCLARVRDGLDVAPAAMYCYQPAHPGPTHTPAPAGSNITAVPAASIASEMMGIASRLAELAAQHVRSSEAEADVAVDQGAQARRPAAHHASAEHSGTHGTQAAHGVGAGRTSAHEGCVVRMPAARLRALQMEAIACIDPSAPTAS